MRRLQTNKSLGKGNSLLYWWNVKNPIRVIVNFIVIYTARFLPSLSLKRIFYRAVGVKVGRDVSFGLGVIVDIFYPELINIGDNTIIGYNTVLLGHEFLTDEWRTGNVDIGKDVTIGANCTILPGIRIGDGAMISSMSLVNKDVPSGSFVGGVPIKNLKKRE